MRFTAVGMTTLGDLEAWEIAHVTAGSAARMGTFRFVNLGLEAHPQRVDVMTEDGRFIATISEHGLGIRAVAVANVCPDGRGMCHTCGTELRRTIEAQRATATVEQVGR